jgi:hypothetical protein
VKAHLSCATRTNGVSAAWVGDRDAADGPQLPALLAATAEHFRVEELSGDKA